MKIPFMINVLKKELSLQKLLGDQVMNKFLFVALIRNWAKVIATSLYICEGMFVSQKILKEEKIN